MWACGVQMFASGITDVEPRFAETRACNAMTTLAVLLWGAVGLVAAVYAQVRVPRFTAVEWHANLVRAILSGLGLLVGYLCAEYAGTPATALGSFVGGFGTVHFPAAIILFIKDRRSSPKS